MTDNTYVIFSSDHGEMLGDHGLYTKSVPYEASVHVPLIVAGPGIKGGQGSDALVELIDLNPTICDLAGVPPVEDIDARSIAPVLRGETEDHRTETVSGIRNFRLIRTHQYKLVQNINDISQLYDLVADPKEENNIADEKPEVVRELASRLGDRYTESTWHR